MKPSFISIAFILIFHSFSGVNSQAATDSCSSNLNINGLPFATTSFNCQPVWGAQGFILRYSQTAPSLWSFVLSAPKANAYVAIGFSPDGNMVGSSAIVGWVSSTDGSATMKRYYLKGQSANLVEPNQGNLQVLGNTSSILYESSRIYLAFQLNTSLPEKRLLYAVGETGRLPSANFLLSEHRDKISTTLNYVSGQSTQEKNPYSNLRKTHGILNMLGWGILMPMGAMVARYLKQWDPIWFYSHTVFQLLGFIFGFAGVICGFVLDDHLNYSNIDKHRGFGIFILALGCLQVIAFLVRPDKASKVRKYWNWYHYAVGRILLLFAAVNIFYGIHLAKAGSGWNAGYGTAVAILLIVSVVLEARMWMKK